MENERQKYKMIIADDEPPIRAALCELYDWAAHDIEVVAACKNGLEAFEAILDESPDIVMTDIRMPGLGGLELMERLKSVAQGSEFIVLSGYRDFEYARQAMALGVRYYLTKPLEEKRLWEAIEACKKQLAPLSAPREGRFSDPVRQVRRYVNEHLSDSSLSLRYIAQKVLYMNVDYLSHLYAEETGEKFSSFLNGTRVRLAREMLDRGGLSLSEIAERVGCGENPRYFGQVFKKYTGLTPTAYLSERAEELPHTEI